MRLSNLSSAVESSFVNFPRNGSISYLLSMKYNFYDRTNTKNKSRGLKKVLRVSLYNHRSNKYYIKYLLSGQGLSTSLISKQINRSLN